MVIVDELGLDDDSNFASCLDCEAVVNALKGVRDFLELLKTLDVVLEVLASCAGSCGGNGVRCLNEPGDSRSRLNVVVVSLINAMLSPSNGLFNQIIQMFGGDPVHFMAEPKYFKTVYVLSDIWQKAGYGSIVYLAALVVGAYDGFYGPGTGTFLLLIFCNLAKLDVRTAGGNVKLVNLASNIGALVTSLMSGKVFLVLGLIGTVTSFLGHFLGAGLAIKNGSKIVKPAVILVLVLLAAKVIQGLIAG